MKNTTLLAITVAIVAIIALGIFMKTTPQNTSLNSTSNQNREPAQKIVLSLKNFNYYPNTITVKEGQPVQISLDKTVSGCLRSFTIPEFGVSKYLPKPSDTVEFTPNKKGTFKFQCSMGMGYGTIIVE